MKRFFRLLASSWALVTFSVGSLAAASGSAPAPVLSITQIAARDAGLYATQIAALNALMKSKAGVDPFLRLYMGDAAGTDTGAIFAVSRAESFARLSEAVRVYQSDPDVAVMRTGLDAVRELGPRTLLKAVRSDGAHDSAWLYNTFATVTDEAGYLQALEELATLLKRHGMEDAHLNVYRVIAGRTDYTHLISFNLPSAERLAALLDMVANEAWVAEWIANSAKLRTVVRNGTYREISR